MNDNFHELIQSYNIIDDLFFHKVMEDTAAAEEMIQIILDDKHINVISSTPQYSLRNIGNRSVVLDLLCRDAEGRIFNVEMQRANDTDHQKRMRYHISNIDTRFTEKGIDFKDLPELFSIMISDFDIFKSDMTVYHIDRVLRERGSVEQNGIHEIYVNAKGTDNTEVTELMKYILDSNGFNPQFPKISSRVEYFKHDNGGESMGKSIAELREEGRIEGKAEGRAEARAEILKNLGISEADYQKILNNKSIQPVVSEDTSRNTYVL